MNNNGWQGNGDTVLTRLFQHEDSLHYCRQKRMLASILSIYLEIIRTPQVTLLNPMDVFILYMV